MTGLYTEKILKSLNKSELTDLFLKSREKTDNAINSLAEEIRELNKNFIRMESDIAIAKNVNNVLYKQVLSAEREVSRNPNTLEGNVLRSREYLPQLTTKNLNKLSARFYSILAFI